jgi:hypothetical protein
MHVDDKALPLAYSLAASGLSSVLISLSFSSLVGVVT